MTECIGKTVATVIIPTYGRSNELEQAIASVLTQRGAEFVEIIVVNDGTPGATRPTMLRERDRFLVNPVNEGASVSRNRGIYEARGDWIFFLDSDDRYISVDFNTLHRRKKNALYFSNILFDGKFLEYKNSVELNLFFEDVIIRNELICQTSSLSFHRSLGLEFDPRLPCNQDWDFVYFQALKNNIKVLNSGNVIEYRVIGKDSISRSQSVEKLSVWIDKLERQGISTYDLTLLRFNAFSEISGAVGWPAYCRWCVILMRKPWLMSDRFLKVTVKRFLGGGINL